MSTAQNRLNIRLYIPEILKGMVVTLGHFFQHLLKRETIATIQYPEQKRKYSGRFRGAHVLTTHPDGRVKCTSCMLCATVCPADCIHIEAEESEDPMVEKQPYRFDIDMLRCVFCGFCVDACPKEALIMTGEMELARFDRSAFHYNKARLIDRPELEGVGLGYRPRYPIQAGYPEKIDNKPAGEIKVSLPFS